MSHVDSWTSVLGVVVVAAPLLMTVLLGLTSLVGRPLSEEAATRAVQVGVVSGLMAAAAVLGIMLTGGSRHVAIELGDWVEVPREFHFAVKFVFDRLSVPMAILSFLLSGTIGAFASKYLHRERGFNRFFVLYALFVLGMVVASLAGNIETLFAGWELVGLSSALLVAFFQERPSAARNGLWVWIVYRVSDAALLLAAVAMHHLRGEGDFDQLLGATPWPESHATISSTTALIVGLLVVVAAAGKSALVPFSGWLPRAMEGPTPSSAVYYGALSVHLGAFLLLRCSSLLERSLPVSLVLLALGLGTAWLAYLAGSVQTDIKSALSFASLSQVGVIVAEIGLSTTLGAVAGWLPSPTAARVAEAALVLRYVALVHLLGHACLRALQFLRAPTLLHDYHTLENAIGEHLPRAATPWRRAGGRRLVWLYRLAIERGYLDTFLTDRGVAPFVHAMRRCDALERRWTDWLSGEASRESGQVVPHNVTFEELS